MNDEYENAVDEIVNAGPRLAAANLDANPDQGARAMQLAQATGLPPQVIYNDPELDNVVRLNTANTIIRNNRYINEYLQASPMASVVSNDDYGNLDEFSRAAEHTQRSLNPFRIGFDAITKAHEAGWEGLKEGWGGAFSDQIGYKPIDELMATPGSAAGALYRFMYYAGQVGIKSLSALMKGTIEYAGGLGESLYEQTIGDSIPSSIDPYGAKGFGKAIKGMLELEFNKPPIAAGISAAGVRQFKGAQLARAMENPEIGAAVKAEPWVSAGKEPPAGIHPYLDKLKADANTEALTSLERDLAIAAQSATRERAPELFQQFAEQHYGNSTIGISGDRVAELYRDRVPTPDDGLLGWVPGIAEKLEIARATGEDVHVPVKDWVARVDPALAKTLNEDIRMWPGGVTKREAAIETTPRMVVDSPLAEVRDAAAIEPMFANGDRKILLRKADELEAIQHEITITDSMGKDVGFIMLDPRPADKTLYIDMISGEIGPGINGFGPSAIRDLMRQLKEMYPEYEYITGHRVSGARGMTNAWDGPTAHPKVRLSEDMDYQSFKSLRDNINNAWEQQFHPEIWADVKPTELYGKSERIMNDIITEEIQRITAGKADSVSVGDIRATKGNNPTGVFIQYKDRLPKILVNLYTDDAMGVARHESIHFLRQYGFFNNAEWAALVKAAREEGWISRYEIDQRYPKASEYLKYEESIAEAFRDWARNRDVNAGVKTPITTIFEKMQALWDAIKTRIMEALGKQELKWEDLFEQALSGEIAKRTDNQPIHAGVYNPKFAEAKGPKLPEPAVADRMDTLRAGAVGLDLKTYRKLQEQIQARYKEDIETAQARAEKLEKKTLTSEWRENLEQVKKEVDETIRQRPDVAADLFLGSGELFGEKLRQRYSLAADGLTPEQIAALPKQYVSAKGLPADDVAQLFGYANKDAMVEALAEYHKGRGDKSAQVYLREQINAEASRIMQMRYGNLDDNIMTAAKDRAFSETELNLLAEEYQAAAMQAGVKAIDRDLAKAEMERIFDGMRVEDIRSDKLMAQVGKHGRDVERALINGDQAGALVSLQKKYMTSLLTKMAIDLEKAQVGLEKVARPYQRREIKGPAQRFVPYIQDLLTQAGYRMRVTPDEIARGIEFHGEGTLGEFVGKVAADGYDPLVSPDLMSKGAKPMSEMTAAEFGEFHDAIRSLNHIARQENRIELMGAKEDFATFRERVRENLEQLPMRSRDSQVGGKGNWFYRFDAAITKMENLVKDLDLRQELGPLWDAVIRPMELAKAKEFEMMEDLAKHFRETRGAFGRDWRKSLRDTIEQDLIHDPYTNMAYDLTRENLIQIMLNWGSRSNIEKYTQGAFHAKFGRRATREELGLYERAIKNMIDQHANELDWQYVQRMWEPFKKWQPEMDVVARNTTGVVPKWIAPAKVQTKFGELEGGYWPVKYDRLGSNIQRIEDAAGGGTDGVFGKNFFRAATSKGHLKERTGYVDFVDISSSLEQAAGSMQQVIHDIAFRDALIQGAKVFYDKEIRGLIRKHYGIEYENQLVPWLKRVSYQYSIDDKATSAINDFLRRARINLVGHALPLNLNVILSPDIGVPRPIEWAKYMANKNQNYEFALKHSKELQHLVYNLDRDYTEALNKVTKDTDMADIRKKAIKFGYAPVTVMTKHFRAVTFLKHFEEAKAAGKTDIEAGLIADSYVRERHGTAHMVDQAAMFESNEGIKMLTIFQGYFNTMYNWQRQIPGNARRGEWGKLMENAIGSYAVGVAFGALLFNQGKEDDSWFKTIAKAMMLQPLQTVPVLGSAATYATEGFQPRMPFVSMLTAGQQGANDIKKFAQGKTMEKPITHGANIIGLSTGLPFAQIGRTSQFLYDTHGRGSQRPKNIFEYWRGIRTGEAKLKK